MIDIGTLQSNYTESFNFLLTRKTRQVQQLILLNNLQRGDQNISSTLLLTLFNRVLSNNYDDKIQIKFIPGEEVQQRKIDQLNLLAQNDYREMNKAKLDYDWAWDTFFFGRGYMETMRFDKKRKLMMPEVINPLVFGYDPYVDEAQQWRYYWKWITKNKYELQKLIKKGIITGVKDVSEIPSGIDEYLWNFKVRRDAAQKATAPGNDPVGKDIYQILEMYAYDEDGDKHVYWLTRGCEKCLWDEKLNFKDNDDGSSKWPIVVKEAYREPHSSVPFSVADLLDDKHRAESVILNLLYVAAKDKANPLYGYNPDKVRDLSQFFTREISQHIPMEDSSAAWPLNTQDPLSPGLSAFMNLLSQKANDPIGTGMNLQPGKKGKQSATETAIQQQLNDLAQSLQSKVMQFGEQEFWLHWYNRYKRYSKKGDEKIATITGVKGTTFEKIDLGDLYTDYPPGVLVFSAKEAEYKELVLRRDLQQMYPQFQQSLTPDGMRNFNKYVFFPKLLNDPSLIELMVPKSLDEIKAERENEQMLKGELPDVAPTDNDEQHLYVHQMAEKTWATWAHMAWHEEQNAMKLAKQQQQAGASGQKPNPPSEAGGNGGNTQNPAEKPASKPKTKSKDGQPNEAVVPLKNNIQPQTVVK